MIVAESRRGRRIVGRLDRGSELMEALVSVCRQRGVRAGEVRALGELEAVELTEYDQQAKGWKASRRFAAGGFAILNLTGNVSERDGQLQVHAHVTLMRDRDNGVEILGGHVISAKVFALEFVIESWDDLVLRRGTDVPTGLSLWNEAIEAREPAPAPAPVAATAAPKPAPAPEPVLPPTVAPPSSTRPLDAPTRTPVATPAPTWSDVAAVSQKKPEPKVDPKREEDEIDDALMPGDVLVHPTFGRCEVQRIEGSYEFAHIRLRNGRLVRLSLDVIKVSPAGQEDGKRVFRARVAG